MGTHDEDPDSQVVSRAPDGIPPTFGAYVVERRTDGLVQGVRELSPGDLPDGGTVVRVDWSAVNFKDGMVATPGNRVARISPLVPGVDLVGTVVASDTFAPGQAVIVHGHDLGVAHHGAYAEYARVPSAWAVPLPSGLTARHAAVIGTAGFTAALSLRQLERSGLEPSQGPVLVTGASGGVGSMTVALLALHGYEVVASTGKQGEHDYLTRLGAAAVIGRDDLVADPDRTLGPERWAGAVDCVGGATLAQVLRTLRYGGAVAASGLTGGSALETTVYPFIVRGVALLGVDTVRTPTEVRVAVWTQLAHEYPAPLLDEMAAAETGLGGIGEALRSIAAGSVRGRVLVRPGDDG